MLSALSRRLLLPGQQGSRTQASTFIGLQSILSRHAPLLPHSNVFNASSSSTTTPSSGEEPRKDLVILGTGWAGYALLKKIDKSKFNVKVISPRSHFLFTPLLASSTVGTLEHRSIIQPIRESGFRDESHFVLASATDVDVTTSEVKVTSALNGATSTISYDYLALAIGSKPNTFGLQGVEDHAFFLKELSDARAIRSRILDNLELATNEPDVEKRAALLTFLYIGGGATGVEASSEFYDFLQQDVSKYFPREAQEVKIKIIEGRGVLSMFHSKLRAYAEAKIARRPEMEIVKASVTRVTADGVELDNGSTIPSRCVVWGAGIGPRDLTLKLAEERGWPLIRNRIEVSPQLSLAMEGVDNVFCLGDCAAITDDVHPQTAQVGETQGYFLAEHLNSIASTGSGLDRPYKFQSKGVLAYLGGFTGLSDFSMSQLNSDPTSNSSFGALSGFHSFVIWRSAYLTKLGSWRLRLQVPLDWTKTLLFGRDVSRVS